MRMLYWTNSFDESQQKAPNREPLARSSCLIMSADHSEIWMLLLLQDFSRLVPGCDYSIIYISSRAEVCSYFHAKIAV